MPKEKEATIVLTGKSGAGKSTLFRNLLKEDFEKNSLFKLAGPGADTLEPKAKSAERNGVKIHLVDTPGLLVGDEMVDKKERLTNTLEVMKKKLKILDFDLLVYCISVHPASTFIEENEEIMKCLHDIHGKDIWKRCVVVFTFSNILMEGIKSRNDNEENVKAEFITKIEGIMDEFRVQLLKLQVDIKDVDPKTTFNWAAISKVERSPENIILGIPAGLHKEDSVLPGIDNGKGWIDKIFIEMLNKCKQKENFAQHRYGKNVPKRIAAAVGIGAAGLSAGAGFGAVVGFSFGVVGGPFGMLVGGGVGVVVGVVAGTLTALFNNK